MKRSVWIFSLVAVLLLSTVGTVFAAYPDREITVIVPWAAGGGTDRVARFLASEMEKELGVPVVVSNRTGGNGAVGHTAAATARANGYTIGNITMELSTLSYLGLTNITYQDYKPIVLFNQDYASVIVRSDAPWNTVEELLDDIKANPSDFTFSGSGAGSIWDLARVGMLDAAGIDATKVRWVPSQGAAPAITELLGGHIDVITTSYPEASPQIESGHLKALAIMSPERIAGYEEIPTLMEYGIDWSAGTWRGFAVPKDTPNDIVDTLYAALNKIVESAAFTNFMENNGFGPSVLGPEEFTEFLEEDYARWERVLRIGGYID